VVQTKPAAPSVDHRPPAQAPLKAERKPVEVARSEEYYDVKTTVFNALIDTIDLTQLGKLDPEAAREEIRDIVSEIVAIKSAWAPLTSGLRLLAADFGDGTLGPFGDLRKSKKAGGVLRGAAVVAIGAKVHAIGAEARRHRREHGVGVGEATE
jgi:hypothetical protein